MHSKQNTHKPSVLVITGPTASGKSDMGVLLAKRYNGEIISADSRQVYKKLDIGSGKITTQEMQGVPHHLLDVAEPGTTYTAHMFTEDALRAVEDVLERGKLPIIVGGTAFYIDSLLCDGGTAGVPIDTELRDSLEKKDTETLAKELQEKDKEAYERVDIKNPRRLVRALEVIQKLGAFKQKKRTPRFNATVIGMHYKRNEMRDIIAKRLDKRWDGMVEEVQDLLRIGITPTWLQGLGLEYRHITRMLTTDADKEEVQKTLAGAILAYAKRQERWWNKNPDIQWFHPTQEKEIYKHLDTVYKR